MSTFSFVDLFIFCYYFVRKYSNAYWPTKQAALRATILDKLYTAPLTYMISLKKRA